MAWLERMTDAANSARAEHLARVRSTRDALDAAGHRTTPPPPGEEGKWVAVLDATNDGRGCPRNQVRWYPRAPYEAHQAALAALHHGMAPA